MLVSVVIINYNTFSITCNCIASVQQHTHGVPYEIVLVDNASPNDNPDEFLVRFPGIRLIKSAVNGGFAAGNNLGIAASAGDVVLLLNSDTILTEDSISIAAQKLTSDETMGAIGVRLTYTDGRLQHTARRFRSLRNELLDLARPILKLMPYRKRSQLMLNQYFYGNYDTWCDWVSGAFMMFRRQVLAQLPGGKLDERFFMYGEDQLWCYQFTELGLRNYYLSSTTVIHIHNASTAPEKQLQLLKKFVTMERLIMEYRIGKGAEYQLFNMVFTAKEMARYWIKVLVYRLTGRRMR
jgi:hypothetical protein